MAKKIQFTEDNTIGEVIEADEKNIAILSGFGLHCFGCPMSQMETLGEAAEVHGFELEMLLDLLNN